MNSTAATTTREIVFGYTDHRTRTLVSTERIPAGTTVYVGKRRGDGSFCIRIPGTLLTQRVYSSAVTGVHEIA
jgi:hypothetical protein